MAEAATILLEQVRTQIAGQESLLNGIRTRATTVVSVAGVVAGLFAPRFLTHSHGVGFAALGAFLVCGYLALATLLPLRVAFSVPLDQTDLDWVSANGDNPAAGSMFAVQTAKTLTTAYEHNRDALRSLGALYSWELGAFGLHLVLWAIAAAVS